MTSHEAVLYKESLSEVVKQQEQILDDFDFGRNRELPDEIAKIRQDVKDVKLILDVLKQDGYEKARMKEKEILDRRDAAGVSEGGIAIILGKRAAEVEDLQRETKKTKKG